MVLARHAEQQRIESLEATIGGLRRELAQAAEVGAQLRAEADSLRAELLREQESARRAVLRARAQARNSKERAARLKQKLTRLSGTDSGVADRM